MSESNTAVIDQTAINERLVNALERMGNEERIRQIPIHKYKGNTPFNPAGKARKIKLTRHFSQNGIQIQPAYLRDAEVAAINKLKPGIYNGGTWFVRETPGGDLGTGLDFSYDHKTSEQRDRFRDVAPTLLDALNKMIAEAAVPVSA